MRYKGKGATILSINTSIPEGHSMNGDVEVLEPRRLEIISRSDELESNRRRAVESLDRVVGTNEVGTLRHGEPNRGEEPSTPHYAMEENSIILDTRCDLIPLQYDSEMDDDDEEDIMIPRLNDKEDNSDDEYEDINMSTSLVNEVGNTYNIDLNNIHLSSIDQHNLENLTMMAVQMNRKSMERIHPGKTKESLSKEMSAILDRNTFIGVNKADIPFDKPINYMMSKHTVKTKDGKFDRVKSRTLIGGDRRKPLYKERTGEISARTISLTALYTCAVLVAYLELELGVFDFQNAFVNATLPESEQCYARMPKEESQIMCEINSEYWTPFLHSMGIFI